MLSDLPDIVPSLLDRCWCRSRFTWELEDTYPDTEPFDTSPALACAARIFGPPHRSDKIIVKHMWRTDYEYDELADDEWMLYYSALVEEDFGGEKGNDMTLLVGDKVATWKLADTCLVSVSQGAVQKFSLGWLSPEMKIKLPILPEDVGFDTICSHCGKSTL
ncbi:hypothetical protein BDV97DRAFT_187767 [Delphinella strobiligena]|nr:hypothetical protein BDV97DRAFT_187767 [Delphinella strobiligena]